MTDTMPPRKARRVAPQIHAWDYPKMDYLTVIALKALASGTANEGQQKEALRWIVWDACATYGLSFRPGGSEGDRETCLAEGKRLVGNMITYVLNMTADKMEEIKRSMKDGGREFTSEQPE